MFQAHLYKHPMDAGLTPHFSSVQSWNDVYLLQISCNPSCCGSRGSFGVARGLYGGPRSSPTADQRPQSLGQTRPTALSTLHLPRPGLSVTAVHFPRLNTVSHEKTERGSSFLSANTTGGIGYSCNSWITKYAHSCVRIQVTKTKRLSSSQFLFAGILYKRLNCLKGKSKNLHKLRRYLWTEC